MTAHQWWGMHRHRILQFASWAMACDALIWLSYEFWRLLFQRGVMGAVDLRNRHTEVHQWFARQPVYQVIEPAWYPPATYALLWPFVGWLDFTQARWLWALVTVAAIRWFVTMLERESLALPGLERTFVALIPLATYPLGAGIGNGQLPVLVLAAVVAALVALAGAARGWRRDLLAAVLLLTALVKPSISAPFFWIALVLPGGWRPVVLAAAGYLAATALAASFQAAGLFELLREWLSILSRVSGETGLYSRYANVQIWLVWLNLKALALPATLLLMIALGVWVYRYRRADLWVLIGVTALVTRFWSYHLWYDDLLIVLPLVTLFRLTKTSPSGHDRLMAGGLLAVTLACMLAPGGLYVFPVPWNVVYTGIETVVWLGVLAFLLRQAGGASLADQSASTLRRAPERLHRGPLG